MHWAAKRGYNEIIKIGINSGANIEGKDMLGRTAEIVAHSYKYFEIEEVFYLIFYFWLDLKKC